MRCAALLLLVACSTTRSAETHAQESATVEEEVRAGPETITTTVEEYGAPQEAQAEAPAGGVPDVQAAQGREAQARVGGEHRAETAIGRVLIKRTVVVDQRAPAVVETHTQTTEAVEAKTASATKPSVGCMLGLGFYAACGLGLLALAAYLYMRLKP